MRKSFHALSLKWLATRMPAATEHRLNHGNIFIFPGLFGLFYLLMTLCLFLLAINYQNNLLLFLCQFLVSLFLITLFSAYKNVAGMRYHAKPIKPVHAGDNGYLSIRIDRKDKSPLNGLLEVNWYADTHRQIINLEQEKVVHQIPFPTSKRGQYPLPRVTFTCSYPLGLVKCWTHLDFSQSILVYPSALPAQLHLTQWYAQSGNGQQVKDGTDDFFALQPWQIGETLNRVAWKRVAKGGDWVNKIFTEQQSTSGYLDIEHINADTETALRMLCWQVTQLADTGTEYGLRLHSLVIPPASGKEHRDACLRALALYQRDGTL